MKAIRWILGALFLLAISEAAFAQSCPLTGKTKITRIQSANKLKNRVAIPLPSDFDSTFTLEAVLAPGNDTARWNEKKAGTLVGYVHNAKPGGIESVNCGAKAIPDRDTHIELVLALGDSLGKRRVIVEVTPRLRKMMKAQGIDWSTPTLIKTLKGKRVEIQGWIFADIEHWPSSENSNPGAKNNWRATVVELHPVTSIRVLH